MNDNNGMIDPNAVVDEDTVARRALMRTVEWLMATQGSIIRLHLPNAGSTREGYDVPCGECGNAYPCESVMLAQNALMGAREFMRDVS